jgi:putative FmdB family regulatory protein
MPLYDFHCDQCGTVFEIRATIKQKEAGLEPECPQCHSHDARQVITAGLMVHGTGGTSGPASCCGGPGCCS